MPVSTECAAALLSFRYPRLFYRVRVFFKVLSSWSFLKSRRLWVQRSHMTGESPSFLGGSGACCPAKFLKTELWKMHLGILGLETLTSEGWIKLQIYRDNHVTQRKTISIIQPCKQIVEWYFLYLYGGFAGANDRQCKFVFLLSLSLDRINIISSPYLDSWRNERSR